MFLLLPFDSLIVNLLGISLTVLFTLLLVFIIVPAIFGVSFGIRKLYMKTLLKIFAWATLRMERGAKEKNHQLYKPYTNGIIAKDPTSLEEEIKEIRRSGSSKALDNTPEFELSDIFYFCRKGMETIMDDEVTKRFSAEELESWNLLSRTNYNFQYISLRLTVLWGLGVLIRYCFLLPLRIALAFTGISLLVVGTTVVGYLPHGRFKEFLSKHVHLMCYRICVRALTAIITYHDRKNRPRNGGICVANHTSPIDVIILASDGYYAMVGQVHGGLMGVIQRAMVKACPHVWFERSEVKDRHLVAKRLTEHVQDKSKLPILIFPEGTCINNTSVMMFKKGSFEIGATVYPVAIKMALELLTEALGAHDSRPASRAGEERMGVGTAVAPDAIQVQPFASAGDGNTGSASVCHAHLSWEVQSLCGRAPWGHLCFLMQTYRDDRVSHCLLPELSQALPVYDPQFGDAFWNSSKYGMVAYLLRMMTSWAIVCSVWYLPPMTRETEEDAVQFANRVKSAIARQGGLVDLLWDGGLKREKVKDAFKEEQQKLYSKMIVGSHEDRSRS
ncbi:Glycerol-3-phosphate acyltransferase 4 [Tupaia chinensis]|uniref:Glycerol-3-phosphate acyltransferase 4 n=1 Tax=Tupaia chinensis TaxID=246437 RepID=L9L9T7_TUPCH|nr:Glycerol-3-phosphate acyltransferase 4 [Tupaia chinensis]